MRGHHRSRIDNGVPPERSLFAQAIVDPGGGQAKCWLLHVLARQVDLGAARVHGHKLANADLTRPSLHLLDAQAVAHGGQAHVVEDADAGHHKAEVGRQRPAQRLDLVGEAAALQIVDQRQQAIAQLDLDLVDGQGLGNRLVFGLGRRVADLDRLWLRGVL